MQHQKIQTRNILVGVFKLRANSHDASSSNSRFLYSRNGEEKWLNRKEVVALVNEKEQKGSWCKESLAGN